MDSLCVEGPARINGEVLVSGSKNAALPLLFASLVFEEEIRFERVPRLRDIETTLQLLETMGVTSQWDKNAGTVAIQPTVKTPEAPYELVRKMRAGILALGPLVARCGKARVSLPGGCAIGARPVGFHLAALEAMGATVSVDNGYIEANAPRGLSGARIVFPQVSVTGTENVLVQAALAKGETILENAASEPEVVAVGELLQQCGVEIEGLGTRTVRIQGVNKLRTPKSAVRVPADRIETGTWIATAAATGGKLRILDARPQDQEAVMAVFRSMGVAVTVDGSSICVEASSPLQPVEVATEPFPGYATDMQAQLLVACLRAKGTSRIRENIFENRFLHVAELRRLGARIELDGNEAIIEGGYELNAAPVMATDLRASASLVVAGLLARGVTKVSRIYHLDRGYQRLDEKLRGLGVNAWRVDESV